MTSGGESSWVADVAARLGLPQGDSYARGYAFLPRWIVFSLGFALAAYLAWRLVRSRMGPLRRWGALRLGSGREFLGLGLFCVLVVGAFDAPRFMEGFFRQDDFSFLQVVRETAGLCRQLLLYHNDHLYPLYRLEVWGIVTGAGPTASTGALAAGFNAVNAATCAFMLLSGCWLLHELGASRLTLLAFTFLTWAWPGWGEFTAGYYTLSAYVQVQALGFGACAAMLRGLRRGSAAWLALSLLLAVGAAGTDVTGVSVFAALLLLCAAFRYREKLPLRRRTLLAILGTLVAVCALWIALAHPYSARELVQNPRGHAVSLAGASRLLQRPVALLGTLLALLGGLFLNLVAPAFLQVAALKVGASAALRQGLLGLEILASLGIAGVAWRRLRLNSSADRGCILALSGCAAACLGMVIAGRPSYALEMPTVLWQAKYMVMPTCWIAVALALYFERAPRFVPAGALFGAAALALWLTVGYAQWERTLLPGPMGYIGRGRWGNLDNARARSQHYRRVMEDLESIAAAGGSRTVVLPPPSAWAAQFYRVHSILEWGGDERSNGVTYLFWDLLAVCPDRELTGRWAPYGALSPLQRKHLEQVDWLRHTDPDPAGSAAQAALAGR
jgi:hypothetical protein